MERPLVAKKLRALRRIAGYQQDEIAKLVQLSRQGYSYFECGHGTPDNQMLQTLATLYGVPFLALEDDRVSVEWLLRYWVKQGLAAGTSKEASGGVRQVLTEVEEGVLQLTEEEEQILLLFRDLDAAEQEELRLFAENKVLQREPSASADQDYDEDEELQ